MGIFDLAPLHSQKHSYGAGMQRRLMRSRITKRRRGVGGGCVELVVHETMEELTDGVQGTFLCGFNAVIRNRVWVLYIWEEVKF